MTETEAAPSSLKALVVDLQVACDAQDIPALAQFERWVGLACAHLEKAELTIRIVDEAESRELNKTYRQKDKPTNVLSFPFDSPEHLDLPLLGDIVICAPIICTEALAQEKAVMHHWAHLAIHGTLHLLGYNHIEDEEAREMEALETRLLANLGIPDPYQSQ